MTQEWRTRSSVERVLAIGVLMGNVLRRLRGWRERLLDVKVEVACEEESQTGNLKSKAPAPFTTDNCLTRLSRDVRAASHSPQHFHIHQPPATRNSDVKRDKIGGCPSAHNRCRGQTIFFPCESNLGPWLGDRL